MLSKQHNLEFTKNIIILIVVSVITILGIGFGIYMSIESIKKSNQIAELKNQISELQNQVLTLEDQNSFLADPSKSKIKIIHSYWSGWDEEYDSTKDTEYESSKNTTYCDIILNQNCTVKANHVADQKEWEEEILSFEIVGVNKDGVTIHTSEPFWDKTPHTDNQQDFIITTSEPLKLTTPTLDEGIIFTLTISQQY